MGKERWVSRRTGRRSISGSYLKYRIEGLSIVKAFHFFVLGLLLLLLLLILTAVMAKETP